MDLRGLQKQEQAPPKGTRKEEVLTIAAEISAMEDKGMTLEPTGEVFFFEKINEVDLP